jgi:inorganic pyrophosphatase
VLEGDAVFGSCRDIEDCPEPLLLRLKHYFLTYKQAPGAPARPVEIPHTYGREEAHEVIRLCREDYRAGFPDPDSLLESMRSK